MDITREIGARIRYYRNEKKLSQEKLSELSDLHPSYIGQLERAEKKPTIETLYRITHSLGLTLSEFFKDIEEVSDKPEETYAIKAYKLIEYQPANKQKHIYNIINNIISM